jgi:hypothetical protein
VREICMLRSMRGGRGNPGLYSTVGTAIRIGCTSERQESAACVMTTSVERATTGILALLRRNGPPD